MLLFGATYWSHFSWNTSSHGLVHCDGFPSVVAVPSFFLCCPCHPQLCTKCSSGSRMAACVHHWAALVHPLAPPSRPRKLVFCKDADITRISLTTFSPFIVLSSLTVTIRPSQWSYWAACLCCNAHPTPIISLLVLGLGLSPTDPLERLSRPWAHSHSLNSL